MSIYDPIADMLTRVRNAILARHHEVEVPLSKMKAAVAQALQDEGYILGYETAEDGKQGILRIQLKYSGNTPVIEGIKRISKPSRRVYVSHDEIPKVMSGLGVNILSTPRGVMSDRKARKERLGGEVVCSVW
ncbi:MAG: 30S ribosomal protein S8 [Desulfarculus sp.]|nr:30S ribosomal protein S8 [Desulfarculus sp.]